MNTVIEKIFQVETAAADIMEDANVRKKAFAKEMADKTAAFDKQLEETTSKTISEIQAGMKEEMKIHLANQQAAVTEIIRRLEETYETNHTRYAKQLFDQMTKE